ncbi:MAG TPA: DUF2207 domain-containing protein, partial [Halanaerobiales bacterium]|nr:DUF2207 domain-containing protein [Halanaerobiales bacterium]
MIKKHPGFLVISLFIIVSCFFNPCSVFAKDYEISNYDIEMQLSTEGDYLITERISYNFLEGEFSTAYRKVSGRGFSGLEFISLESRDMEIIDYEVKEGKNLEISWEYPFSSGERTFIIRYKALGGLLSRDNQNVIDWNPVGDDWSVPVKDIDIRVFLPWDIDEMEVQPADDLVYRNGRELHFHYEQLPPSTHYHLVISFPKKVETGRGEGFNFLLFFLLLIPGIILMVFDLTIGRRRVKALMPEEEIALSFTETSLVYFGGMQNRKGVSAAVFNLARRAKIKLVSRVSKAVFGSKKVEVEPVILSED